MVIFHASMNTMNPLMGLFPIALAGNGLIILFAAFVIVLDRMWRRLPVGHPAVQEDLRLFGPEGGNSSTHVI